MLIMIKFLTNFVKFLYDSSYLITGIWIIFKHICIKPIRDKFFSSFTGKFT